MENLNKMTKSELITLINNNKPKGQDVVRQPAHGFIDQSSSGNSRVKLILSEAQVMRLLDQVKDGYVGLTASFITRGNATFTTEEYISTFDDASNNYAVNLTSMVQQIEKIKQFKSGNFEIEGANA